MGPFGHMSMGFAARSGAKRVPLPVLLLASYVIELVYFVFSAFNLETPDWAPWSHSLLMAMVWSLAAGALWGGFRRDVKGAAIVTGVAFSHWVLDFMAWDSLPLGPGMTGITGLGLYGKLGFSFAMAGANLPTVLITALDLGLLATGIFVWIKGRART